MFLRHHKVTASSVVMLALAAATNAAAGQPTAAGPKNIRTNPNGTVTIDDPAMGFKLVLPKGTQEFPAGVAGNVAYYFVVGTPPESYNVAIEKLGGKIGKEMPSPAKMPPNVKIVPAEWRSFKVFAMRMEQTTPEGLFIDYIAQIPLRREAIQLHVVGPVANEEKVKKAFSELLTLLGGDTNWT